MRGAFIYIYATVFNDCQMYETGEEVWNEMKIARLGWLGGDEYSLAYFRHTGKWHNFMSGSLDKCLQAIKHDEVELFWVF